ncbi:MAG TPA: ribbon-helix-helix protein, CopG family [Thermosynechococcaceae cyanobacterium]
MEIAKLETFGIRVKPDTHSRLQELAQTQKTSKGAIVRVAVEQFLISLENREAPVA